WIGLPRSDSFVDRFFQNLEVRQQQFGFYNLNVSYRVYITEYMGDIPFLKAPDDVSDSVYGSDVAQELIAQSFTLAGSLDQARNVDELDKGGRNVLRVEYFFERCESGIWYRDNSNVAVDGGKRIVGNGG